MRVKHQLFCLILAALFHGDEVAERVGFDIIDIGSKKLFYASKGALLKAGGSRKSAQVDYGFFQKHEFTPIRELYCGRCFRVQRSF